MSSSGIEIAKEVPVILKLINMKKILVVLLVVLLMPELKAQVKQKVKEFGIITGGFSNTGLTYRFGNEKSLWRVNLLSASFSGNESDLSDTYNYSAQLSFGREFRKELKEKIQFRYGVDINPSIIYSTNNAFVFDAFGGISNERSFFNTTASIALNIILGFNYELSDNMIVGVEVFPGINYTYRESIITESTGIDKRSGSYSNVLGAGMSSSGAKLSFVYRY